MRTEVSIIIPVLNEEGNIITLLNEIKNNIIKDINYEVIVIDDGSNDKTFEVLLNYIKTDINTFLIKHKKNYGQSISLHTGVLNAKYDLIATLDGDGQNDPKDIIKLLQHFDYKKEFMMVIGNRVQRHDSLTRKIASRAAFKIRRLLLNDNTPDTGCAIKIFKKKDFLNLPFFNHIHRFLPFLFNTYGGKVISVPVNHRSRKNGKSKYSNFQRFLVGVNDILGVIWLRKRSKWPVNYEKINNIKS